MTRDNDQLNMDTPAATEWLATLDEEDLRAVVEAAAREVPGFDDWLRARRVARSGGSEDLLALVNDNLRPRSSFYDYHRTNTFAVDADPTVQILIDQAGDATPDLLMVIERAITLLTRAILKADDSSGMLGGLIRSLLDAHAEAARSAADQLDPKAQIRLVRWIVKYRYGGKQDYFDPDIVAYAPALDDGVIDEYRKAIAGLDLGPYGRYPLQRLAVLDRDADAIVEAHGGEPHNDMLAASIVRDMEEAGLRERARHYALMGVRMAGRGYSMELVDFLVQDAFEHGDTAAAVRFRRDWFAKFSTSSAFDRLRQSAQQAGTWNTERPDAERLLAERNPEPYARYLMGDGRDDEAWDFATERLERAGHVGLWVDLCVMRARTRPDDTIGVHREVITEILQTTDKRNYRAAAKQLKVMRTHAKAAGGDAPQAFAEFLDECVAANRRRPRCMDAFRSAGLM